MGLLLRYVCWRVGNYCFILSKFAIITGNKYMYYVYLIKSRVKHYFYTGCTNDLKDRIKKHNNGDVISTKAYRPFDIVYYEACLNDKDAYSREKYLKKWLGKINLRKRLKNCNENST